MTETTPSWDTNALESSINIEPLGVLRVRATTYGGWYAHFMGQGSDLKAGTLSEAQLAAILYVRSVIEETDAQLAKWQEKT